VLSALQRLISETRGRGAAAAAKRRLAGCLCRSFTSLRTRRWQKKGVVEGGTRGGRLRTPFGVVVWLFGWWWMKITLFCVTLSGPARNTAIRGVEGQSRYRGPCRS